MSNSAARYLRRLAGQSSSSPATREEQERLSAAELARALRYAKEVRAPIVALEAIQDELDVARYDEQRR